MKIYLIRHGEKEGHGFDAPLTENGKSQIELLASKLKSLAAKAIYASNNPRSYESAKIIGSLLGIKINKVDKIQEFKRETFFNKDEDIDPEEKENLDNLRLFISEIISKKEDALLVMNAGVNRAIMCHLLKIPLSSAISLTQDYSSITELELKDINGEEIWCLNSINKTDHLK